jgi:hypothetical protein
MCEALTVSELPKPAAFVPPDRPASDAGGSSAATAATSARLWFIPLVIVFAVALVWLLIRWPGSRAVTPQEIVRDLGRPGKGHWQQAYALAELLHSPQHAGLKQDTALAAALAALLEAQLDDGSLDASRLNMRIFLCRALGEFTVPAVQPVLLRASRLERNPAEIAVRRAAVEAIAAHAVGVGPGTLDDDTALAQTLIATAQESGRDSADKTQREELRASVAFALGVLGSDPALAQLQRMLDNPSPNVRYNAATGLARHGHAAAFPVLLEMLDPGNPQAVAGEVTAAGRTWKREAVLSNAIRAAQLWAERNPQADRGPLVAAVETLVTADLTVSVRTLARRTLPSLSAKPKQ